MKIANRISKTPCTRTPVRNMSYTTRQYGCSMRSNMHMKINLQPSAASSNGAPSRILLTRATAFAAQTCGVRAGPSCVKSFFTRCQMPLAREKTQFSSNNQRDHTNKNNNGINFNNNRRALQTTKIFQNFHKLQTINKLGALNTHEAVHRQMQLDAPRGFSSDAKKKKDDDDDDDIYNPSSREKPRPKAPDAQHEVFDDVAFQKKAMGSHKLGGEATGAQARWKTSKLQERFTHPSEWKDQDPNDPLRRKPEDLLYKRITVPQIDLAKGPPEDGIRRMTPQDLNAFLRDTPKDRYLLIDLRSPEYLLGEPSLPNAVSWPIPLLTESESNSTNPVPQDNFFADAMKRTEIAWKRKYDFARPTAKLDFLIFYSSTGKRSDFAARCALEFPEFQEKTFSLWGGARFYNKLFKKPEGVFFDLKQRKFEDLYAD